MLKGGLSLLNGMKNVLLQAKLRRILFKMFFSLFLLSSLIFIFVLWMSSWVATMWLPDTEAWWGGIASLCVWFFSFALCAAVGAVLYVLLSGTVVAPYLDMLAAEVDHQEASNQPWMIQMKQSAQNTAKPMLTLLLWGGGSLVLLFIPVMGAVLAGCVWFYACMRFLMLELMDVPCSRRAMSFEDRQELIKKKPFFYYSFALSAMALMMLPVINILTHPSAVVGLMLNSKASGLDD